MLLIVVNLDPHHRQSGWVELDLARLGLDADAPYQVHDLLTDARYLWHGRAQLRRARAGHGRTSSRSRAACATNATSTIS